MSLSRVSTIAAQTDCKSPHKGMREPPKASGSLLQPDESVSSIPPATCVMTLSSYLLKKGTVSVLAHNTLLFVSCILVCT